MPSTSPALDLSKRLEADGFLTPDINMSVGEWDTSNGRQVLFMDGPSIPSQLQDCYEAVNVQVLIRGNRTEGYPDVYTFAKSVYDYIINLSGPLLLDSTCYQSFSVDVPLQHLRKDENNRHNLTMSFNTYRNF